MTLLLRNLIWSSRHDFIELYYVLLTKIKNMELNKNLLTSWQVVSMIDNQYLFAFYVSYTFIKSQLFK